MDFQIFTFSECKDDLTECSCCPLNCFSVPAKSPICRNPNTLPSCSTSTSPSAASRLEPGQACQLPGLALKYSDSCGERC